MPFSESSSGLSRQDTLAIHLFTERFSKFINIQPHKVTPETRDEYNKAIKQLTYLCMRDAQEFQRSFTEIRKGVQEGKLDFTKTSSVP